MAGTTRKTPTTRRKSPASTTTGATTGTRAKPAPKPAVEMPEPTVVTVSEPVLAEADLRKKELIELVVERSEIKKKYAKPAVEATLAILGEMIASGRELNLQPLGKLRINRSEEKSNGRIIICKLRQSITGEDDTPEDDDGFDVQAAE